MEVTFSCPSCGVLLRAPHEATGRKMRCPACQSISVVPDLNDKLGETVSNWMLEDIEEEMDSRDQALEQQRKEQERKAEEARQKKLERERKKRRRVYVTASGGSGDSTPAMKGRPESPKRRASDTPKRKVEFPQDLLFAGPRPYLIVKGVESSGVRLAFDSRWLKSKRFRASLPRRCVQTGERDGRKLVARPMVFKDYLQSGSIEEIKSSHEMRSIASLRTREVAKRMGTLEGVRSPFNQAMPYYSTPKMSLSDLKCDTYSRDTDDGVTCEVTIPDGSVALEWLKRVNGICGIEHELLEQSVGLTHGDVWGQLPDATRKNLEGWCKLGQQEECLGFFRDAEFSKNDEGLAGLIVTNQRLLFQKYHRKGEINLSEPQITLMVRAEGLHAELLLITPNHRQRMCRIRQKDVAPMAVLLEKQTSVNVTFDDEAASA